MAMNEATTPRAFLPEHVTDLIVQPVERASIALQVAQVVNSPAGTASLRVPIVTDDPSAAWTAEGAEIAKSDAGTDEVDSPFYKLAGLTVISNELAADSSPAAQEVVGAGLARDLARKIDAAFFGTAGSSTVQPKGLGDIAAANLSEVDAGTAWENTDPFVEAIYAAETVGATVTGFVASPADALALAQLKEETGSKKPLLGADPSSPTRRAIAGVPLFVSEAVTAGTIWGVPGAGKVLVAMRQDATIEVDRSAFFASDQTAIRAILRCAIAVPHPAAVQKITLTV